jgi:phosphoglycolate phosphatase
MMTDSTSIVLFDLDGTLVDSAPDFIRVLNRMRSEDNLPILDPVRIRNTVSNGSRALITLAYDMQPHERSFETKREYLLDLYFDCVGQEASLFPGMDKVLKQLEQHGIPWGIVTNKPERFTTLLIERLGLTERCAVAICPDHVKITKPDPEGLLLACARTGAEPARGIYVGDHVRDIQAGKAAGMKTVAVRFGYIEEGDDPESWEADWVVGCPSELPTVIWRTDWH